VRIGVLWRVEWDPVDGSHGIVETCKLHGMFAAFAELGIAAEPVVYSDDSVDVVRDHLLALDGVLVWVNPIEQGLDRSKLDPLLREVAEDGVWVSAHPDVILKMGTKQVLVDTQEMSWGTHAYVYRSAEELRQELPLRLAAAPGPLVLKQYRGMGGNGVWKVEATDDGRLRVQHAVRDAQQEHVTLDEFVARCEGYFVGAGRMVEQPFQNRLDEGMIRVYLVHDRVAGFAHQYPKAFLPASDTPAAPKRFEQASSPAYQELKTQMESEWMPELRRIVGLEPHDLPVIWDADFVRGSDSRHVLCEINVSSTFAFPEHAMPAVAGAALERAAERRRLRDRDSNPNFRFQRPASYR
jgi:hypothetical protein